MKYWKQFLWIMSHLRRFAIATKSIYHNSAPLVLLVGLN